MKIGIIGFGDLGKQIRRYLENDKRFENSTYVIFDDFHENEKEDVHKFNDYRDEKFAELSFFVGLGYKHLTTRNHIFDWLIENQRQLGTFIHPSAIVDNDAQIDPGVIMYPGCIVDQRVRIETGSIINNGVIISHDSQISRSCFLAPGVIICGFCSIENCTFIGAGSVICDGLTIGKECRIGLGSCITESLSEKSSAIGSPFKIISELKLR